MKRIKKYFVQAFTLLLIAGVASSCTSMDEAYKDFVKDGEISYTGKIDSLHIYSGKNRVKVEGLIISDPKVSEVRIFWNSRKDSVVVPITRTQGIDELNVIIDDLVENVHNFEVITFDKLGNKSVSVNKIGTVYGDRYQSSLYNRPITSSALSSGNLIINFASMDLSSGVLGTEVEYKDVNDIQKNIFVPIENSSISIADFNLSSDFTYRTLFLPNKTCIDTFFTNYITKLPDVIDYTYLIKNNKKPFEAEEGSPSATFVNLKDWITNPAAKPANGYGGLHTSLGNSMNFETVNSSTITNGKSYQTMNLPAGNYKLTVVPKSGNYTTNLSSSNFAYIAVAKGASLPNSKDGVLETDPLTLGYKKIVANGTQLSTIIVSFTLTEETEISLGLSMTYGSSIYCVFESFTLEKSNK